MNVLNGDWFFQPLKYFFKDLNGLQLEKSRVKKGMSASDKVKCVPERLLIMSRVRRGMRILGGAVKAVLY